jgi:hypothetical protein
MQNQVLHLYALWWWSGAVEVESLDDDAPWTGEVDQVPASVNVH